MYCDGRHVGIGAIDHQAGEVGVLGLQVVEFEMVAVALYVGTVHVLPCGEKRRGLRVEVVRVHAKVGVLM